MRRIIRLLEPYNVRWSNWHGSWLVRVGLNQPWLDMYRANDPNKTPQHVSSERHDCIMEILETPITSEPVRIYTRSRVDEWRERMRDHRRTSHE